MYFIINQCTRTKDAKILSDSKCDLFNNYLIPLLSQNPEFLKYSPEDIDDFSLKINKRFEETMLESYIWVTAICDLTPILIRNTTDLNFISSDAPVVKNNYINDAKYSFMGYQSIGLQIFLPLNPKLSLLFYDPAMYTIPDAKKGIVSVSSRQDVDKINRMQIKNCLENVIFSDLGEKEYVKHIHLALEKEKKSKSIIIKPFHKYKPQGELTKEIVVVQSEGENPNIRFSFIKQNHHLNKQIKNIIRKSLISGTPVSFYRNQDVVNRINQDTSNEVFQKIIRNVMDSAKKT